MADEFESHGKSLVAPATRHVQLTANAAADLSLRPRAIYCQAAGTITVRDEAGVDLPYTMNAGATIAFRGVRIISIASGTFYGLS